MNLFTMHPQSQGITYTTHLIFAMGIALRLLTGAIAFFIHAILPFIGIQHSMDLEATTDYLQKRNDWIEGRKRGRITESEKARQWKQAPLPE